MVSRSSVGSIRRNSLVFMGILLIASNLRPAITSVGPLIGYIREDFTISSGAAGFLTTLPLLAFAILSPIAAKLGSDYQQERVVFAGLLILLIGMLMRYTTFFPFLLAGTAFIGIGIAIGNVLVPSLVKKWFPNRVGFATGMYTTTLSTFAAIASGVSVPLAHFGLGWRGALGIWVALCVAAILFWLPQLTRKDQQNTNQQTLALPSQSRLWRSGIAWQVTIFMGSQSFLFYSLVSWLPEILQSQGLSTGSAGAMLAVMQFCGLPATFLTPMLAGKLTDQKGLAFTLALLYFFGFSVLLLSSSPALSIVAIVFIGVASGGSLSLALTFMSLRANSVKQAAALSGMAQSLGYLLAALGPFLIGLLFDVTGTWNLSLLVFVSATVLFLISGLGAGRNQFVSATAPEKG
nr:MFS transporter [Shouchella shacheensis]